MDSFHSISIVMSGKHKKPIFKSPGTYQNRLFMVYEVAYTLQTTKLSKNLDYGLNPLE
jgi:hypothetical protein